MKGERMRFLRVCNREEISHFTSRTPSMSPRGIFNKTHPSLVSPTNLPHLRALCWALGCLSVCACHLEYIAQMQMNGCRGVCLDVSGVHAVTTSTAALITPRKMALCVIRTTFLSFGHQPRAFTAGTGEGRQVSGGLRGTGDASRLPACGRLHVRPHTRGTATAAVHLCRQEDYASLPGPG